MKILLILDELKHLNVTYDSSLAMVRHFTNHGHQCYFGNSTDLYADQSSIKTRCRAIKPKTKSLYFSTGSYQHLPLKKFDAVLVRKEPPFNIAYVYMTALLQLAEKEVLILNHPRALRDTNEKLSTLEFEKLMPKSIVTSSTENIFHFQSKINKNLIVKPLDERGGRGITPLLLKDSKKKKISVIRKLTQNGTLPIIAQEFIARPNLSADKRIFILEGKFLAAYERRFAKNDFRGNLSQGATAHQTNLTDSEKKTIAQVCRWLKKKRLHFVGLDLLGGKLLEINVTCPGGFPEADELYPHLNVFDQFAFSVEKLARKKKRKG